MNDYGFYTTRRTEFGKLLARERKKAGLTQAGLADRIEEEIGNRPEQNTISNWEQGKAFPGSIETVFAMSRIFGCDCGYLLGDYEERTHDSTDICKATGLSELTVNGLCNLAAWGVGQEAATVIDALMFDFGYQTKGEKIAPLIYLLNWYLKYDGGQSKGKGVNVNGKIMDTDDTTGYLGSSLNLDSRLIENAALMEIQQGLISLKKRIARKERGHSGQHQTE